MNKRVELVTIEEMPQLPQKIKTVKITELKVRTELFKGAS
jgi:hypothetical protein